MSQIADQIFFWLDGFRLSQFARLEDPSDSRAPVPFTPAEKIREIAHPGRALASFTITAQDYDAPTLKMLQDYTSTTELAWLQTLDPTAGAEAIMYRVRTMTNNPNFIETSLAVHTHSFNVSQGGVASSGLNLFAHTTDITAPVNGDTISLGALLADESFLVMMQNEAASAAGTLDAKIVADPTGTPSDAHVFATVTDTDVPTAEFALINGPSSETDYRVEITAVSAGTWNAQFGAVKIREL